MALDRTDGGGATRRRAPGLSLDRLVKNDPYKRKLQAKKRATNDKFKRFKQKRQAMADDGAEPAAGGDDEGEEDDAAERKRMAELMAEAGLDQPAERRKKKKRRAGEVGTADEAAASAELAGGGGGGNARGARVISAPPAVPPASGGGGARELLPDGPSVRGEKRAMKAQRAQGRMAAADLQRQRWEEDRDQRDQAKAKKQAEIDAAAKKNAHARKSRHSAYGKLSQRTARGQPVMRHQIDRLLAQIERVVAR
ncbi:hypothetical protein T492DRAFT_1073024 [Pavlovales sp. CCMP2436]|nr:hypothetical protein T492DRAFT_1073024 [Pavlovales sp. CCMP2436]